MQEEEVHTDTASDSSAPVGSLSVSPNGRPRSSVGHDVSERPNSNSFFIIHEDIELSPSRNGHQSSPSSTTANQTLVDFAATPNQLETQDNHEPKATTASSSVNRSCANLNRCGSAPDLPPMTVCNSLMTSPTPYASFQKRSKPTGAGYHLVNLQRTKLVPLATTGQQQSKQQQQQQSKVDSSPPTQLYVEIGELKARTDLLQKQNSSLTKQNQHLHRQLDELQQQNAALGQQNQILQQKSHDFFRKGILQKKQFDQLAGRYSTVFDSLQNMVDKHTIPSSNTTTTASDAGKTCTSSPISQSMQKTFTALSKQNLDFQRKLRIYEAQHAEDKKLITNLESRIKRMKAEMEAFQHLHSTTNETTHDGESYHSSTGTLAATTSSSSSSSVGNTGSSTFSTPPANTNSTESPPGSSSSTSNAMLTMINDNIQYIDPSILKVLEKVDSQFSITNVIQLSVVLKKWFQNCQHMLVSMHVPTVLQTLLSQVRELLHCENACVFEVHSISKRLVCRFAHTGEVHWEMPIDKGVVGYSVRTGLMANVPKANDDPRFSSTIDTISGIKTREMLCIPIVNAQGQITSVLQASNTSTRKPFTTQDQILGSLLAIQVGVVLDQTKIVENVDKNNAKLLQLLKVPQQIMETAAELAFCDPDEPLPLTSVVYAAQKIFNDIQGLTKMKMYVVEVDGEHLWHVGQDTDVNTGKKRLIRRYSRSSSSLCGLVMATQAPVLVEDPMAHPNYNETVDLDNAYHGVYLVPMQKLGNSRFTVLGVVQVARQNVAKNYAVHTLAEEAQRCHDRLMMEVVGLFAQMAAVALVHAQTAKLMNATGRNSLSELQQAQWSTLRDRLENLEQEAQDDWHHQQQEEDARARAMLAMEAKMHRLMEKEPQRITVSQTSRDRQQEPDPNTRRVWSAGPTSPTHAHASDEPAGDDPQPVQPMIDENSELSPNNQQTVALNVEADEVKSNGQASREPTPLTSSRNRLATSDSSYSIDLSVVSTE